MSDDNKHKVADRPKADFEFTYAQINRILFELNRSYVRRSKIAELLNAGEIVKGDQL